MTTAQFSDTQFKFRIQPTAKAASAYMVAALELKENGFLTSFFADGVMREVSIWLSNSPK